MKKLFVFLILTLVTNVVSAQWSIGGKVGMNWSKVVNCPDIGGVKSDELFDIHFRPGLNLGAVVNYQLSDWFDLQGELLYSQYNFEDKAGLTIESGSTIKSKLKYHNHYLDIPLLVQFYPLKHDSGFSLEAGVQPGFFLAESVNIENVNIGGDNKPVSCALVVGSSFKAPENWFIDFRYIFGLTDTYKNMDGMNMQSAQISVGYLFRL